jgi:hypothetical protein
MRKRRGHKAQVVSALNRAKRTELEFPDKPNPQSGLGMRNLDCRYYEACLDLAVFEQWESFNCKRCKLKNQAAFGPGATMQDDKMWTELLTIVREGA